MTLNIYATIGLVILCFMVIGFILRKVKQLLLIAIIFALLSGSFTASQFSPNKLLKMPNIKYVQSNKVESVEIIPLFGNGTTLSNTSVVDVLKGPTSVMVEYNSKKVLDNFMSRYN